MKVVTAATALTVLGPERTFHTGIYGRVTGSNVADLVIEGHGDPTLDPGDLSELAQALVDRGVRTVERIHVDADFFDDQLLPPSFEQQPGEVAYFRAAVGGLVVDESTFVLRVAPGAEVNGRASVRLRGAGYFELQNDITTVDGPANVLADQSALPDGRMRLRVSGTVPPGSGNVSYRRRVENPVLYAGYLFADALAGVGIRGTRTVSVGAVAAGMPLLADHESASLGEILRAVGKQSDNFVAEMVLKQLGANRHTPGSSAEGVLALQEYLDRAGVAHGAATIVNGSGLFQGNRIAAGHLCAVLVAAYKNPAVRHEFVAQLAIAGVDGTLRNRLRNAPSPRVIRAKTGTLNDVISLSGYVLGAEPGRVYAFSMLANGVGGKTTQARELFDSIALALAQQLHPRRN
jgi:D-alanyl-D-alanine carboxypeptidase/D-alanyl-D-alanine-endopeptidase (penicillin-binding protein 4)